MSDASFNNFQIFMPDGQLLLTVDQLFNEVEVIRRVRGAEGNTILQAAK